MEKKRKFEMIVNETRVYEVEAKDAEEAKEILEWTNYDELKCIHINFNSTEAREYGDCPDCGTEIYLTPGMECDECLRKAYYDPKIKALREKLMAKKSEEQIWKFSESM